MVKEIKKKINVPVTLIFSEPGAVIFHQKGTKLQKFNMADNKIGYGTSMQSFDPRFIQKMIFNGYLWKLEICVKKGSVPGRRDFIELTKAISQALFFRQFFQTVQNEIYNSNVIRQWNRVHPRRTIDSKTRFNNEFLSNFLNKNAVVAKQIKEDLQAALIEYFKIHTNINSEEKEILTELSEQFISFLGPTTLFLLSIQRGSSESVELMTKIREILISYFDKSIICEYMALLLVELLIYLRPELFLENQLSTPGSMSIGFGYSRKGWVNQDDRVRMKIRINDEYMLQKNNIQKAISDKSNHSAHAVSLKEFYENAQDNIGIAGLGLYYLSYLKEACNNMGITFESMVSHIPGQETEVNLALRI